MPTIVTDPGLIKELETSSTGIESNIITDEDLISTLESSPINGNPNAVTDSDLIFQLEEQTPPDIFSLEHAANTAELAGQITRAGLKTFPTVAEGVLKFPSLLTRQLDDLPPVLRERLEGYEQNISGAAELLRTGLDTATEQAIPVREWEDTAADIMSLIYGGAAGTKLPEVISKAPSLTQKIAGGIFGEIVTSPEDLEPLFKEEYEEVLPELTEAEEALFNKTSTALEGLGAFAILKGTIDTVKGGLGLAKAGKDATINKMLDNSLKAGIEEDLVRVGIETRTATPVETVEKILYRNENIDDTIDMVYQEALRYLPEEEASIYAHNLIEDAANNMITKESAEIFDIQNPQTIKELDAQRQRQLEIEEGFIDEGIEQVSISEEAAQRLTDPTFYQRGVDNLMQMYNRLSKTTRTARALDDAVREGADGRDLFHTQGHYIRAKNRIARNNRRTREMLQRDADTLNWVRAQEGANNEEIERILTAADNLDDYTARKPQIDRLEVQEQYWQSLQGLEEPHVIGAELAKIRQEIFNLENVGVSRTLPDGTTLTEKQARQIVEEAQANPVYKRMLDEMSATNRQLLYDAVDAGLISRQYANDLIKNRPNYIPATRAIEEVGAKFEPDLYTNQGVKATKGQLLRGRKGKSKVTTLSPLEARVRNTYATQEAIRDAKYKQDMFRFLWQLEDNVWDDLFVTTKQEVRDNLDRLKRRDQYGSDPQNITITPQNKEDALTYANNYITFRVGKGNSIDVVVKDKGILDSLNVRGPKEYNNWLYNNMAKFKNFQRDLITVYDPSFPLVSFIREAKDFPIFTYGQAWRGDYIPWVSNIKTLFQDPKTYHPLFQRDYNFYNRYGRMHENLNIEDQIKLVKGETEPTTKLGELRKATSHRAHSWATRSDMSNRYLEYQVTSKRLRREQPDLSPEDIHQIAISRANDLGVNYSNIGANPHLNSIIRLMPFTQVALNSLGRFATGWRYNPKQTLANYLLYVYAPYEAINLASKSYINPETGVSYHDEMQSDDDPYYQRVHLPGMEHEYIKIPLGFMADSLNPATSTLIRALGEGTSKALDQLLDRELQKDEHSSLASAMEQRGVTFSDFKRDLLTYFTKAWSVPTRISGVATINDLRTGKDAFGRSIEPSYSKGLEEEYRVRPGTSEAYKLFAQTPLGNLMADMGASPAEIEYTIQSFFPTIGEAGGIAFDAVYSALNDDEYIQGKGLKELPISRRFIGGADEYKPAMTYTSQFWRMNEFMNTAMEKIRLKQNSVRENYAPASELEELEDEYADVIHFNGVFQSAKQDMVSLYEKIRDMKDNPKAFDLTTDEQIEQETNDAYRQIEEISTGVVRDILKTDPRGRIYDQRGQATWLHRALNIADKTRDFNNVDTYDGELDLDHAENLMEYLTGGNTEEDIPTELEIIDEENNLTNEVESDILEQNSILEEAKNNLSILETEFNREFANASEQDRQFLVDQLEAQRNYVANLDTTPKDETDSILDKIMQLESGGRVTAKNRKSTASGIFQFTDKTWEDSVRLWGKELGITTNPKDKANPKFQRLMAEKLLEDNTRIVREAINRDLTPGEKYLTHFAGAGDATKLLQADPNLKVSDVLESKVIESNESIFLTDGRVRTVGEVLQLLEDKMSN